MCRSKTFKNILIVFFFINITGCMIVEKPSIKIPNLQSKAPELKSRTILQKHTALTKADSKPITKKKPAYLKADLIGKNSTFILKAFGKPQFQRTDPPSKLLRYTNKFCLLDIYLYTTKTEKIFNVYFIDTRSTNGTKTEFNRCLREMKNN
tara:strand:- start:3517 stop:3969 length:453 start_codon:yes stop_codon:yes gene_type:complete